MAVYRGFARRLIPMARSEASSQYETSGSCAIDRRGSRQHGDKVSGCALQPLRYPSGSALR
jgi:hypothetical protein